MTLAPANAEHAAAVARLEADLFIATPAGLPQPKDVVAAYRRALAEAAGRPFDPRWTALGLTLGAFIARIQSRPRSNAAAAALARLDLLRFELLAEIHDLGRGVAG
jgi:hypothetical protein